MYIKQYNGKKGEDKVCNYLRSNNYLIFERNFRCRQGEIDIICYDTNSDELVFIEVKTRSNAKYGRPCEAVGKLKKNHIIYTAKYYNYKNDISNVAMRFDIVEVFLNNKDYKINHIKNVF